jgi:hypothetical protein
MSFAENPYVAKNPYGAPPPKKSSSLWIVLLVVALVGTPVAILIAIPLICCGGCMAIGSYGLKAAGQQIAAEIQNHPSVQEHLGGDLVLNVNFVATAAEQEKRGSDRYMVFDAQGSKGSGQVIVETQQGPGTETFRSAVLRIPDGREFQIK